MENNDDPEIFMLPTSNSAPKLQRGGSITGFCGFGFLNEIQERRKEEAFLFLGWLVVLCWMKAGILLCI